MAPMSGANRRHDMATIEISDDEFSDFMAEEDTLPDVNPFRGLERQLNASKSLASFTATAQANYGRPAKEPDEVPGWMRRLDEELRQHDTGPGWAGRVAERRERS